MKENENLRNDANNSLLQLISLQGRNAVVTGGARGIGEAIVHRLAEAGANIVIADMNTDLSVKVAHEINERYKIKAFSHYLDVSNSDSIIELINFISGSVGTIDIWVNCARTNHFDGILDTTDAIWDKVTGVNLRGSFMASREAAKKMVADHTEGVIINIISTAGLKSAGNPAHYVASKHGLAGLTKSLGVELARHKIRAIGIAPTIVDTPLLAEFKEQANDFVKKGLEEFASRLPLGRGAYPDDIARVVLFAASGLAKFMTGVIIPVDGGETAV